VHLYLDLPTKAVMTAEPFLTAVTTPLLDTLAVFSELVDHLTPDFVPDKVNVRVLPTYIVALVLFNLTAAAWAMAGVCMTGNDMGVKMSKTAIKTEIKTFFSFIN